ncbi:SIS domain-containing protein [Lachnospiraceae bacterium 54-53]
MNEKIKETMMTYVKETPGVILENVKKRKELTAPLMAEYEKGDYDSIWIVASGSSYNGSYCARQFMRNYLKSEVKIVSPFTFLCSEHDFTDRDFVFVVSQSGYSTNSLDALKLIRGQGRASIGITGNISSDMKEYADVLIDYGVGVETVGYVTKGVASFALFLMLFTLEAAVKKGLLYEDEAEAVCRDMEKAAHIHEQVQKESLKFFQDHYKKFTSMNSAYVCGSGANYGTALEGALKLGETVKIPAAAYESEEFIHGPNLQLTPAYTVFFIDGGKCGSRIRTIFKACREVTDSAFLITNQPGSAGEGVLNIPADIPELLTPLCFLPFFQILAYQATTELNRWKQHPLLKRMKEAAACKTENYVDQDED